MAQVSLQQAFDQGFERVKSYLDEALAGFEARIGAMEREFKYLGTWDSTREYQKNNFVTHNGSIWSCAARTRSRPGDSADWQLAVKRGQDAR